MKCVIGGAQLRVFGRAIHAIARISDEFWFDPVEKGSVLPVFRCVNVLERNVEKCSISTSPSEHHITFQLLCRHGVVKTYNLTFQECDPLQAVFAKHMCPNILKVHSRLLADVMIHFPTSQEEITLSITPMKVCFKSYTEEDTDFSRTMLTEIQLSPEEFDYFQVGVDSEVTFCLKELRGLLAFSEATSVPVSIHFDRCGKPIAFSIEDLLLEASFILATLCEAEKEAASPEPACHPRPWDSSRTGIDKSDQASMDGASNAATATSKKPQQKKNTPSMDPAKPPSALAKQEVKNIPRGTERDAPGRAGAATAEAVGGEATEAPYAKVRELPVVPAVEPHSCCLAEHPHVLWGFQWDQLSQHSWKTPALLGTLLGAGGFHWEMLLAEKDRKVVKASQIINAQILYHSFLPVQILHFPVPLLILWSRLLQGEGGHW
ncbi:cell cycle checkpoint control protein RAD9B isoform X2 [Taeniopygia guttata]|uniref:cell cycle checkpoint control protein RAD9B isoform X2 n=1 Tax=Taeniopygia guttata TaxID=59729 RepID=UPI003BB8F203